MVTLLKTCRRAISFATCVMLGPLLLGCGPSLKQEAAASRRAPVATADVAMPPNELAEAVKAAVSAPPLSVGVAEQDRGVVITGWKRHRGDWHIGRYWQERTRYRVEVAPDWDEPLERSRLSVIAETEQRAAEGQRWDREARVARPQRAQQALRAILAQVQPAASNQRAPEE